MRVHTKQKHHRGEQDTNKNGKRNGTNDETSTNCQTNGPCEVKN